MSHNGVLCRPANGHGCARGCAREGFKARFPGGRKSSCIYVAFDLLYLNGKDLRILPLIERKRQLRKLLARRRSRILYLDHVENDGKLVFEQIVKMDLGGMVCKRKSSP